MQRHIGPARSGDLRDFQLARPDRFCLHIESQGHIALSVCPRKYQDRALSCSRGVRFALNFFANHIRVSVSSKSGRPENRAPRHAWASHRRQWPPEQAASTLLRQRLRTKPQASAEGPSPWTQRPRSGEPEKACKSRARETIRTVPHQPVSRSDRPTFRVAGKHIVFRTGDRGAGSESQSGLHTPEHLVIGAPSRRLAEG
jgi:hypothetical protein